MEVIKKHLLDGTLEQFGGDVVPKIPVFAGEDITSEVYYFKPNQVLRSHRHPKGEQIFVFLKGEGKMLVGDKSHNVDPGSIVFVKTGEWHEIINGTTEEMVAVQVTKVDAGAEYRQ